jgi:hypothetical protein
MYLILKYNFNGTFFAVALIYIYATVILGPKHQIPFMSNQTPEFAVHVPSADLFYREG